MQYNHEAIFCIVNSGYSEAVMDAAKKLGASGGTVINARGTASKEAEMQSFPKRKVRFAAQNMSKLF